MWIIIGDVHQFIGHCLISLDPWIVGLEILSLLICRFVSLASLDVIKLVISDMLYFCDMLRVFKILIWHQSSRKTSSPYEHFLIKTFKSSKFRIIFNMIIIWFSFCLVYAFPIPAHLSWICYPIFCGDSPNLV